MKRPHVHIAAGNPEQSIGFYSAPFGTKSSAIKPGYAKWMLEDPKIDLAASKRYRACAGKHSSRSAKPRPMARMNLASGHSASVALRPAWVRLGAF